MARFFSKRQKKAMQILQGNRCANCGIPLLSRFHGDHRIPYSKGGETTLKNGDALCPRCNLKKGSKMANIPRLRRWQHECHEKAIAWYKYNNREFYINAAPGTGKTLCASVIANSLLVSDVVKRVIVIAPSIEVVNQWADTYQKVTGRTMMRVTGSDGEIAGYGTDLCCTWAGLTGIAEAASMICDSEDALVICDEHHHTAENAPWGLSAEDGLSGAKNVLILSGTLERTDDARPIWLQYDENGLFDLPPNGSYTLTYGQAIQEGYCRPATFHRHHGQFQVQIDSETTVKVNAGDDPAELRKKFKLPGLSRALNFYKLACTPQYAADGKTPSLNGYQCSMVLEASNKLDEMQLETPSAGGLIICPSIGMAEYMAKLIEMIEGETPTLVHYRQPNRSEKIRAFRNGNQRWIVSVNMISEGTDIPRLRVLVYLPYALTELLFRQSLGRIIRSLGLEDSSRAYVIMPAIRLFDEYAKRIEQEIPPQARPERKPSCKTCPVCQHPNPVDALHCQHCEHDFQVNRPIQMKTCPECGTKNRIHYKSCLNCGNKFVHEYQMELAEALRDGAVVRGIVLDEDEVKFAEEHYDEIRDAILRSGDAMLITLLNQLPKEAYGRLKKILDGVGDD